MRHLISIASITTRTIWELMEPEHPGLSLVKNGNALKFIRGPIALMFHEPSTRTKFSFMQAALNTGITPLDFNAANSSEVKGESLLDSCRNLAWMGVKAFVIRTSQNGLPGEVSLKLEGVSIINAGDGTHEHPTQALGDARTLRDHFGRIDGLKIAIVGDIEHSRVARSDAHLLSRLGAQINLVGSFCPEDIPRHLSTTSLEEGLANVDAVIVLRHQSERWAPGNSASKMGTSLGEEHIARYAKPNCVVMHPGPINRGVEVTPELIGGPRSLVQKQVENGVRARTRVLQWMLEA